MKNKKKKKNLVGTVKIKISKMIASKLMKTTNLAAWHNLTTIMTILKIIETIKLKFIFFVIPYNLRLCNSRKGPVLRFFLVQV